MSQKLLFLFLLSFNSAQAAVSYTWLGTTGTYFTDGKTSFLIDPVVTRPSLYDEIFNRSVESDRKAVQATIEKYQLKHIKAIFVSHSHFDHAIDAPEFARQTSAILLGSPSTANIGKGDGLPARQIHTFRANETIRVGSFKITVLDATHPPLFCGYQTASGLIEAPLRQPTQITNFKMGGAYSFLIEHADGKIFFHPTSQAKANEVHPKADILFLGVASRKSDDDTIDSLVTPTAPRIMVPLHFDDFFSPIPREGEAIHQLIGVDLAKFLKNLKEKHPEVKSVVPYYGKATRIL